MRAVALRTFSDLSCGGIVRARGERFDAPPARIAELRKLGIADVLEKQPTRRRAARKQKE